MRIDPEFKALIPPLTTEERAQLEANILKDGCRDPLVVWKDILLDGHNRYEICTAHDLPYSTAGLSFAGRDEAKAWIIRNQFGRRNLQPYQRAELALKLEPLIAVRAKENQQARKGGQPGASPQKSAELKPTETRREVAKAAGVSHDTIAKAKLIADKAPEPVKEALRRGETTINHEYKRIAQGEKRQQRIQQIIETAKAQPSMAIRETYPVIYADPPWRYEHSETESRAIENQYPTMDLDGIRSLDVDGRPVSAIATPDAVLFLWATSPKLAEAMTVVEAWGFTYRTCMVWVKDKIGMGYYARQRHELLLIATRGTPPTPAAENRPDSVVMAGRGAHSAKPGIFADLIVRMYPTLPRIELFARGHRKGWAAWGNQAA